METFYNKILKKVKTSRKKVYKKEELVLLILETQVDVLTPKIHQAIFEEIRNDPV